MKTYITKYLIVFALLSLILFILYKSGIYTIIYKIRSFDIVISLSICLAIFFISGLKISYLSKLTCGKPLSLIDTLTLPIAMNLWGYIIPIKGGMLYSIFYLKKKYKIELDNAAAISIFTYSITLSILGVILVYINYQTNEQITLIYFIAIILITNLFLVYFLKKILSLFTINTNIIIIIKINNFIHKIFENLFSAILNVKLLSISLFLSIIHIATTYLWYYTAADSLDLKISTISILFLVLASQLSMIIKVLPGNLGFTEALMGATTALTEGGFENGLVLAVYIRSINLLITLSIGVITATLHLSKFKSSSILSLTKQLTGFKS